MGNKSAIQGEVGMLDRQFKEVIGLFDLVIEEKVALRAGEDSSGVTSSSGTIAGVLSHLRKLEVLDLELLRSIVSNDVSRSE